MERIGLFTTKFTPRGEKLEFSLQNLHHVVKIAVFITNLHYVVKIPVFTTNLHHVVKIFTTNLHHVVKIFTTYLHHMVKIFTTKFSPHVVKMAVFTTFTLCGENFHYKIYTTCGENSNIYTTCSEKLSHFHHIIYTTCGENYTVKSKIGLTSLMSGVQLKIFQVVVKIIISCHLVLKNFI